MERIHLKNYLLKRKEHFGIISISGKTKEPIEKLVNAINQIEKDTTLNEYVFNNTFIRITSEDFKVTYKKKNKYKTVKRKYKMR